MQTRIEHNYREKVPVTKMDNGDKWGIPEEMKPPNSFSFFFLEMEEQETGWEKEKEK